MSFYVNPFYPPRPAQPRPYSCGYASPYVTPAFPYASPAYPYAANDYDEDIEAEERAALAHLRAIQERKEAAQVAARREAAIRARVAAEREAAIAAAIERERAREEAIRHAIAAERHRQLAREQHAIEMERRRRAIAAQKEAVRRKIEQQQDECRRKAACARQCAQGCARASPRQESEDNWQRVNDVLGALLGLNFAPQQAPQAQPSAPSPQPATTRTIETPKESPAEKSDKLVNVEAEAEVPKVDNKPVEQKQATPVVSAPSADTKEDAKCEINLNDLISSFLGFDVTPATASDKATEGSEQITERLNDFLSQFGLEFEPIKNGESSTAAQSTPAPAPATAQAPTSDTTVDTKGKGIAEGEKPNEPTAVPAPTPADAAPEQPNPAAALDKLRDISHELHLATESFTFPEHLAFAPTPASDDVVPPLLFNKQNSKYHAQAHKLLQLLLAVDGISSGGDKEVRKQRKALVKAIEGAIESLEVKRDEAWKEVKEKRERGEESDDEGSVGSWATEWTDDHHSTPQDFSTPEDKPEETADKKEEEAKGFQVPAANANDQVREEERSGEDLKESEAAEVEAPSEQKPADEKQIEVPELKESEAKKNTEKEDGYELL